MEIVKLGRDAIIRYYERKKSQEFTKVREAKQIFVGEGAAGKTSLKLRLQDKKAQLPEEYERTRGIEITHWKLGNCIVAHVIASTVSIAWAPIRLLPSIKG
jgi:hypothetical protein